MVVFPPATGGADDYVTVKLVGLVAVPPGVVTEMGPVLAPDGTHVVIFVAESPV
ncbi:MAG: hypothetical protein M3Q23_06055 [Actinomycetota bacterium]|nr:hypothetical protein [Actinomycetota bacterium]